MKCLLKNLPLVILCAALFFSGCEGSDTREQVDDTVKELSGQKNVERMHQMKKNISEIEKQQDRRMRQVD